ncbi:hypothetical protein [Brevundimonas sp. Marseille-Q4549]
MRWLSWDRPAISPTWRAPAWVAPVALVGFSVTSRASRFPSGDQRGVEARPEIRAIRRA